MDSLLNGLKSMLNLLILVLFNFFSIFVELILDSLKYFVKSMMSNDAILSGIISGAGSFFGGVIGAGVAALVAFKVARQQLSADKNKEVNQFKLKCRNYVILLIHEIEHNKYIYKMIEEGAKDNIVFETAVWEKIRFEANAFLTMEQYDILEEIYREIRDIQSGRITKFEQDFFTISFQTLNKVNGILKTILEEINRYLKKQKYF